MLKFTIISAQPVKQKYVEQAESMYTDRLTSYASVKIIELKIKVPESADAEQIKSIESEKIIKSIPSGSYVVALDEKGKMYNSQSLAKKISEQTVRGSNHFTFIIGGAYGLSENVIKIANLKLSLSELTFTYQLARLVLIEQLYRITMIIAGKPYHKA
jgi:23S rRNA (pseudouridine1915-N3)-methyltransferase